MKPFDLEEAKAGKPVIIYGAGQEKREIPVEIVRFDQRGKFDLILIVHDKDNDFPLYADSATGITYNIIGNKVSKMFMKSETKTGWINIYKSAIVFTSQVVYDTKTEALSSAATQLHLTLLDTIEITYKE